MRYITSAVSGSPPPKGAKKQRGHITSAVAGKRWPEGLGQVVLSWPGGPSSEERRFDFPHRSPGAPTGLPPPQTQPNPPTYDSTPNPWAP